MSLRSSGLWAKIKFGFFMPEYPTPMATASMWVATPLILLTSGFYTAQTIIKPAGEVVGLCLSVVGITGALSAICAQLASVANKENRMYWVYYYSAEKFLHSCLLLIQILIVVFVRDSLLSMDIVSNSSVLKKIVEIVFLNVAIFVSCCATGFWYWGFFELNSALWLQTKDQINRTRSEKQKAFDARESKES